MKTSIYKVYRPILVLFPIMDRGLAGAEVYRNVFVEGIEIQKVFFDHFPLVTERDDEFLNAVSGIDFHNVPQNRLSANLDHRFRAKMSLFRSEERRVGKECRYRWSPY